MVWNVIYAVIFVLAVVPSWQVGTIKLDEMTITHKLEEQANLINRYNYSEVNAKRNIREYLEKKGLPAEFTYDYIEEDKVRISYEYRAAATVFGYTYYHTHQTLSGETTE